MTKIIFRLALLAFISLSMSACKKYEVQNDGAYDDNTSSTAKAINYEIVYTQSGKLYMTDPILQNIKSFPSLPLGIVTAVISPNFDKIAYRVAGGNINIIDTSGKAITTLVGTTTATSFDWHENNETLYYIDSNWYMKFYGPTVKAILTNFNSIFPTASASRKLYAVNLRGDGSVIFIRQYNEGFGYQRHLVTYPYVGVISTQSIYNSNLEISWMKSSSKTSYVYYGGIASLSEPEAYSTYVGSYNSPDKLYDTRLAAMSLDGNSTLRLTNSSLRVTRLNNYSTAIDGTKVTSIDW
jgi:hypothetical protein